jgi:hypothetical protein
MNCLRFAGKVGIFSTLPCCRCGQADRYWDRIAGKPFCPNCQEALVLGEAPPLIERTEKNHCAVCTQFGTVRYWTLPLHAETGVEMDLCAEHLRCLLGRRLGPHAFQQLRRQLEQMDVGVEDVFLLHGAFYDRFGRALRPAGEAEAA